jgi:hypothetical protein
MTNHPNRSTKRARARDCEGTYFRILGKIYTADGWEPWHHDCSPQEVARLTNAAWDICSPPSNTTYDETARTEFGSSGDGIWQGKIEVSSLRALNADQARQVGYRAS